MAQDEMQVSAAVNPVLNGILEEVVTKAWSSVIMAVNKILEADNAFGFSKIEAKLNPSIHDIVHGVGLVDGALTYFLDSELLDTDLTRLALNSKQCVIYLRRAANALKNGDEEEYKAAIRDLTLQPKI